MTLEPHEHLEESSSLKIGGRFWSKSKESPLKTVSEGSRHHAGGWIGKWETHRRIIGLARDLVKIAAASAIEVPVCANPGSESRSVWAAFI